MKHDVHNELRCADIDREFDLSFFIEDFYKYIFISNYINMRSKPHLFAKSTYMCFSLKLSMKYVYKLWNWIKATKWASFWKSLCGNQKWLLYLISDSDYLS